MTELKNGRYRWANSMTSFARTPFCKSQVACDGKNLSSPARIAKGICASCEELLKKRQAGNTPPRGANYKGG